jgi:hypothetical protein
MILHRMSKIGLGHMPHVASNVANEKAVTMIREWIKRMPKEWNSLRTRSWSVVGWVER